MFLTDDEVFELTGYKYPKWQVAWLRERGWIFETNRLGRPKVEREYCRSKMGNQVADTATVQPNWAAI